jgi:hypothetical protein
MDSSIEILFVDLVSYLIPGFLVLGPITWFFLKIRSISIPDSLILAVLFFTSFILGFILYHFSAYTIDGVYYRAKSRYPMNVMVQRFPQYLKVKNLILEKLQIDNSIDPIDVYLWSKAWALDLAPKSLARAERVAYLGGFARVLVFSIPISSFLFEIFVMRENFTAIGISLTGIGIILLSTFLFRTYWVLSETSVHLTMMTFLVLQVNSFVDKEGF